MRSYIYLCILISTLSYNLMADYEACVTVNTTTGTYTIDPSGCVPKPQDKSCYPDENDLSFAD